MGINLGKFVGEGVTAAILKLNPFGPEGYARRDRNKAFRKARRKKKRGEPLTEQETQILTQEVDMLQGKLTHTGAGVAASSPFVGILVNAFVPHIESAIASSGFAPIECAAEAASCVTAGQLAIGLVTGVIAMAGGAIASYGRKRAERRHAAELAAAQAKQ